MEGRRPQIWRKKPAVPRAVTVVFVVVVVVVVERRRRKFEF